MTVAKRNPFAKKAAVKKGAPTAKNATKNVGKKPSNRQVGAAKKVAGAARTGMKTGGHSRKGY